MQSIKLTAHARRMAGAGLVAARLLLAPQSAVSQQLTAVTLPLKDPGVDTWHFNGKDMAVGVDVHTGLKQIGANVNGYALTDPKFLWRYEVHVSDRNRDVEPKERSTDDGLLYVGNGPLSLLDVSAGRVRWTLECERVGFVNLNRMTPLAGDRLLLVGTKECNHSLGASYDETRIILLNNATGEALWEHAAKTQGFDYEVETRKDMGYGATVNNEKEYQIYAIPLAPGDGTYHYSAGPDADRVLVIGERRSTSLMGSWSGRVRRRSDITPDSLGTSYS